MKFNTSIDISPKFDVGPVYYQTATPPSINVILEVAKRVVIVVFLITPLIGLIAHYFKNCSRDSNRIAPTQKINREEHIAKDYPIRTAHAGGANAGVAPSSAVSATAPMAEPKFPLTTDADAAILLKKYLSLVSPSAKANLERFSEYDQLLIVKKVDRWNRYTPTGKEGRPYNLSTRVMNVCTRAQQHINFQKDHPEMILQRKSNPAEEPSYRCSACSFAGSLIPALAHASSLEAKTEAVWAKQQAELWGITVDDKKEIFKVVKSWQLKQTSKCDFNEVKFVEKILKIIAIYKKNRVAPKKARKEVPDLFCHHYRPQQLLPKFKGTASKGRTKAGPICLLYASNAYILQTIGALYLKKGNGPKAFDFLHRALKLDPTDLTSRINRTRAMSMIDYKWQEPLPISRTRRNPNLNISTQGKALTRAYH